MKLKKKLVALVCGVALASGVAGEAFATSYHNGGAVDWAPSSWDPGVTSIFSKIWTPPYPDVYYPSFSTAYNMIRGGGKWAQTGWYKQDWFPADNPNNINDGVHYYMQVYDGSGNPIQEDRSEWGPAAESWHEYRTYKDSNGNWVGQVDGVNIGAFPANFKGIGPEYSEEIGAPDGETPYKAAFPGTTAKHSRHEQMRVYYNNWTYYSPIPNTAWSNTDPNDIGQQNTANYTEGISASWIELWDSRK
jgi:hypothetical protein